MPIYHSLGRIPRKRHTVFRKPDGGLYAEELMGHEGFIGTSSLLYHTYPPTTVKSAKKVRDVKWEADDATSLRHRHFRTAKSKKGGSPTLDRVPILFNDEIAMLYAEPDQVDGHFYRNSQADEVVYVGEGRGVLESPFGDLPYMPGDYVIIHRNITHRWQLDQTVPNKFLIFESRGHAVQVGGRCGDSPSRLLDLDDDAWFRRGRRHAPDRPGDDNGRRLQHTVASGSEPPPDRLDVLEAVQKREDDRAVERLGRNAIERRFQVVGLDGDDQQRHRPLEPGRRLAVRGDRLAPADEAKPVGADRFDRSLGADAERTRRRSEEAADPAEPEYRDRRAGGAQVGPATDPGPTAPDLGACGAPFTAAIVTALLSGGPRRSTGPRAVATRTSVPRRRCAEPRRGSG